MDVWGWCKTITLIIVVSYAVWVAGKSWPALGQPHAQYHSTYENWKMENGNSCCNDQDCDGVGNPRSPAEAWRFGADGYELRMRGSRDWIKVPPAAVRPYTSPDGNAHACIWHGNILCFVVGSGV